MKHDLQNILSCPVCDEKAFKHFISAKDHNVSNDSFNVVECCSCGFRFTNPKPSETTIGKYYQSNDYISHTSSKKGLFNFVYHLIRNYQLKKKEKLISLFNEKGKTLLDFGSGTGEFLNYCQEKSWKVVGVEPEKKAAEFAQKNYNLCIEDVSSFFSFDEEKFDVITLWHVLEHVYDLNKYLNHFQKVLKKNGIIVLGLPNCNSHDAKYYKENWVAWDLPIHLYHFTKKDIKKLAKKHGFVLEEVFPLVFDSFYISMLSQKKKGKSKFLGLWRGFVSNLKAKKTGEFSSHIYVLRKTAL